MDLTILKILDRLTILRKTEVGLFKKKIDGDRGGVQPKEVT